MAARVLLSCRVCLGDSDAIVSSMKALEVMGRAIAAKDAKRVDGPDLYARNPEMYQGLASAAIESLRGYESTNLDGLISLTLDEVVDALLDG